MEKQENLRCFEYYLEESLKDIGKNADRPSKYDITKYEVLGMTYPVAITKKI